MTKADALLLIKKHISECVVDDFISFRVSDWCSNKELYIKKIGVKFKDSIITVRSSSVYEDALEISCAGKYITVKGINPTDKNSVATGIEKVIGSYEKDEHLYRNQVIIQKQLVTSILHGAMYNYDFRDNSPYYLIEYDDSTQETDTVTGFGERKRVLITRNDKRQLEVRDDRWTKLISIVNRMEKLFDSGLLHIEFAFDENDNVHIFQGQGIKNRLFNYRHDDVFNILKNGEDKYKQLSIRKYSMFSNMSDWNPVEMLGSKPKPLSVSLYRHLISYRVWKTSRDVLGYYTPSEDHLIRNSRYFSHHVVKLN